MVLVPLGSGTIPVLPTRNRTVRALSATLGKARLRNHHQNVAARQ
jgi:hypothetical protein